MSGHHPWSELRAKMSPERQARIKAEADKMHREYTLAEIRRQAGFTQCQMAEKLNVSQPAYAGFESSDNMRLGTLQKIVTALGGELSLRVLIGGYEYDLQKSPQVTLV